jgi:Fe-S-cluster containining protein
MQKERRLIREDGFSFTFDPEACKRCGGRCCNGKSGDVFVNSKEIKAISEFLGIETPQFIEEYLRKVSYRFSIREIKTMENYACIFFDGQKNRCSVYPVRPRQCKAFPFWSRFRDKPEEAARECPGVSLSEK